MLTKPLLIATLTAGLSVATFSSPVSADPVGGAIVGGAIGAAVGGPPGAAVGAILGTAIGSDVYYHGPHYAYGAPYYDQRNFAPPADYGPPPGVYNAPAYYAPAYYAPAYYAPARVHYVPRVVYARPAYVYAPPRYYGGRHVRGAHRWYR